MNIKKYSTDYQDVFIDLITKGKENGTYLEIGSGDPIKGSNTYFLEKERGWTGISIEKRKKACEDFCKIRKNKLIQADATTVDYTSFLFHNDMDYLQIDCNPPEISFSILKRIPLNRMRFSIITFEHDYWREASKDCGKSVRALSRDYLHRFGYYMVVSVCSRGRSFEDWWIHPDLINEVTYMRFCRVGIDIEAKDYIKEFLNYRG